MSEEVVKLTLTGRVSYEHEITVTQAAQVISIVNAAPGAAGPVPAMGVVVDSSAMDDMQSRTRATTPREALELSGAKTNAERIVAFGAYILQDSGLETFTQDEVKPLFRQAREPTPRNFSRDLDAAIRSGWVATAKGKGELYLTAKAADVLESGFDPIRSKRGKGSKARGNGSKKTRVLTKPEAFAEIEEFPTSLDRVPSYHQIGLKRDKVLWALKLAKDIGAASLGGKDIEWLTNHLGEAVLSRDTNGHFKGLQKQGYANRSAVDGTIRITPNGEAYLQTLSDMDK